MSDEPAPVSKGVKAATIVWALVAVGVLTCATTGVVTLFGSKFGPAFQLSAEALAGDERAPKRVDAGVGDGTVGP